MNPEASSLQAALRYPFQGEGWQGRFAVGAGLLLAGFIVPILPVLFVYGYLLRILRAAIDGFEPSLPPWDDWGALLKDGFKAFLVGFLYLLPATAVFTLGLGLYCGTFLALPIFMGDSSTPETDALLGMLFLIGFASLFVSMALGSLLALAGAIPVPAALGTLVRRGTLSAAFRWGELRRVLSANPWGYLIAWLLVGGLMGVTYFLSLVLYYTLILICFLPFLLVPVWYYVMLVGAALFGQAYREGTARVGSPEGSPA